MKVVGIVLFLVIICTPNAYAFFGVLNKVISGDTIIVKEDKTDSKVVVRLYGIDAPDEGQIDYQTAKLFLEDNIRKSNDYLNIVPVSSKTDRFGRIQAFVYKNGVNINRLMVSSGLALVLEPSCTIKECGLLRSDQSKARDARVSLWSIGEPDKPWEARESDYIQYANSKEGSYEGIYYFTDKKGKVVAADPEVRYVIHVIPILPPSPPLVRYVPTPTSQQPVIIINNK
ncbi:MAG: thermonuclease family protein [Desulfovibrio sp.]